MRHGMIVMLYMCGSSSRFDCSYAATKKTDERMIWPVVKLESSFLRESFAIIFLV